MRLLGLFIFLLPLQALGDAVPPPPAHCPRGQVPITSHHGPECVAPAPTDCPAGWRGELRGICSLDVCESDQSCGPGKQCRQVELCLQEFILEWGYSQNESSQPGKSEDRPRSRPLFAGPPMRYDPPRHEIRAVDVCGQGRGCQAPARCGKGKLCLPMGVTRPGIWPKPPSAPRGELCPAGSHQDAGRAAALLERLRGEPESASLAADAALRICFVPGSGPGVLSGELALLDGGASDSVLAARLAHLLIHRRDGLGEGCASGLAAARESERSAQKIEAHLRARYGLSALAPSDDAERDYRRRCPTAS